MIARDYGLANSRWQIVKCDGEIVSKGSTAGLKKNRSRKARVNKVKRSYLKNSKSSKVRKVLKKTKPRRSLKKKTKSKK